MTTFLLFLILISAMTAACLIGFWVAQKQITARWHSVQTHTNKMAQTIEQLRDNAAGAEADKSLSWIASDRDRERVNVWRLSHET